MVVRAVDGGWYLVTQPDHADLAGTLARHWTYPALSHSDDPEFLEAVRRHDAGWADFDTAPRFHPDGSPISFLEWPLLSSLDVWRGSIRTAQELGRTAGCVVARHFCVLGRMALSRDITPEERTGVQEFLCECQPAAEPACERLTRILQICDVLSLQLITAGAMTMALLESLGVRVRFSDEKLLLNPFPFDQNFTVQCPARFLPRGSEMPTSSPNLQFGVLAG